jgi:hypothetical protein
MTEIKKERDPKYPRVLMLVLASHDGPDNCYTGFCEQWLRYANSHPNIDCYLYKSIGGIATPYELDGNVLKINRGENWNDILYKTFDALEYFQPKFHEYDWICRPNMSAFFHFEKYLSYLASLPESTQVEAVHCHGGGIVYPSGAGFSFRSSIGDLILKNKQPTYYVDDMTFGKIFHDNTIQIHNRPVYDCVDNSNVDRFISEDLHTSWKFQYRFKTNCRRDDVVNYKKFVDSVYSSSEPNPSDSKQNL